MTKKIKIFVIMFVVALVTVGAQAQSVKTISSLTQEEKNEIVEGKREVYSLEYFSKNLRKKNYVYAEFDGGIAIGEHFTAPTGTGVLGYNLDHLRLETEVSYLKGENREKYNQLAVYLSAGYRFIFLKDNSLSFLGGVGYCYQKSDVDGAAYQSKNHGFSAKASMKYEHYLSKKFFLLGELSVYGTTRVNHGEQQRLDVYGVAKVGFGITF